MDGVDIYYAEEAIIKELDGLKKEPVKEDELEKVRNKFEAETVFSNTSILNKAMNLSVHELLGDAGAINKEVKLYRGITSSMVIESATDYLKDSNCSTIYYKSIK
jgi:zinc protease